jgi:fucose 4-O-acetylase-like acetyltransferase
MRAYYLDRIRIVLTILVIAHHSAITYGASGGWFLRLEDDKSTSSLVLTLLAAVNQTFFMGFFFLISGYLTPSSYDRKGWFDFVRDRLIRLGLPTLFFGFVIGPLTVAIARTQSWDFAGEWFGLMAHGRFVIGPMWFAYALLVFSLAYVAWRRLVPVKPGPRKPVPEQPTWIVAAVGVGAAALIIRQFVPVGEEVLELQLGYFASYIFLFALGCVAERYGWLAEVKRKHALPWVIAAAIALPLLPIALVVGEQIGQTNFATGFSFPAIFYAFWEPVVAWGIIAGMLWIFHLRFNEPDKRWGGLARQTYGAFIVHPPVIVTIALLLEPLPAPALIKFLLLATLGTSVSFATAWAIRKIPFVRLAV